VSLQFWVPVKLRPKVLVVDLPCNNEIFIACEQDTSIILYFILHICNIFISKKYTKEGII
jgi:hypothetical protein